MTMHRKDGLFGQIAGRASGGGTLGAMTAFAAEAEDPGLSDLPPQLFQDNIANQVQVLVGREVEVDQALTQGNDFQAGGAIETPVIFVGPNRGKLDIEAGKVVGVASQTNTADQIQIADPGAGAFASDQAGWQLNWMEAQGDLVLAIWGGHRFIGSICVDIGQLVGEFSQDNTLQQGVLLNGEGSLAALQQAVQNLALGVVGNVYAAFSFAGRMDGTLADIRMGLATGEVHQSNFLSQAVVAECWFGEAHGWQSAEQLAALDARGTVSFALGVGTAFLGTIRDMDIGLVTGSITQMNLATQDAYFGSMIGAGGLAGIGQEVRQANWIEVHGDVGVGMTTGLSFKGTMEDVRIGLITADVTQVNSALQDGFAFIGRGGEAEVEQKVFQENLLRVHSSLSVSIVVEENFTGAIRGLEIGLLTGSLYQSNDALQSSAAIGGTAPALWSDQQNSMWLETLGNVNISLVFKKNFTVAMENVTIGLATTDLEQTDFVVQNAYGNAYGSVADLSPYMSRSHVVREDGKVDLDVRIEMFGRDAHLLSNSFIGIEVLDLLRPDGVWG